MSTPANGRQSAPEWTPRGIAGEPEPSFVSSGLPDGRARKRRRIPVACAHCREKKSKCDGDRPVCTSCATQNIECVYAAPPRSLPSTLPTDYVETVEARLATLEKEVRLLKASTAQSYALSPTAGRDHHPSITDPVDETLAPVEDDDVNGVSADATNGVGTIEFTDQADSAYFGPSSNIAFERAIKRTLLSVLRDSQPASRTSHPRDALAREPSTRPPHLGVSRPQSPTARASTASWFSERSAETFHMPPEAELTRLARRFFSDTAMLFPYVHEGSFWDTFAVAKASGFRRIRKSWLGLVYIILAMAISTDPQAKINTRERAALSDSYFSRARALCMGSVMAGTSVEIIQVMLFMTQYLQGTHRSIQTWTIHGIAVKAALQLGLHAEDMLAQFGPIERETRVRVWHACVFLDRTLCMTLGRPPAIPESYVRLPLPRHNLDARTVPLNWSREESSTHFWNAVITLYQILCKSIEVLYDFNTSHRSGHLHHTELVTSVINIDQQLSSWEANLPPSIRLLTSVDDINIEQVILTERFQIALTLRYHNLKILAHRPVLDRQLEDFKGGSGSEMHVMSAWTDTVCIRSAAMIIEIVSTFATASGTQRGHLGAWWFTLYYAYNASLVLIALLLRQEISENTNTNHLSLENVKEVEQLVDKSIVCMPYIDADNGVVNKCVKFLSALRATIKGLHTIPARPSYESAGAPYHHSNPASQLDTLEFSMPGVQSFAGLSDILPADLDVLGFTYDGESTGTGGMDNSFTGGVFW